MQEKFMGSAVLSDVVLACRVSPAQKAEVVEMVR